MTGKGEICNGKECGCKWLDEGLRIWHEKSGGGKRVEPSTVSPWTFTKNQCRKIIFHFLQKSLFDRTKCCVQQNLIFKRNFVRIFFYLHHLIFWVKFSKTFCKTFWLFLLGNIWKSWFRISLPTWLDKIPVLPTFFCRSSGKRNDNLW